MTWTASEARRIAANIARLPELLPRPRSPLIGIPNFHGTQKGPLALDDRKTDVELGSRIHDTLGR